MNEQQPNSPTTPTKASPPPPQFLITQVSTLTSPTTPLHLCRQAVKELVDFSGGDENLPQHDANRTQAGEAGVPQAVGQMLQRVLLVGNGKLDDNNHQDDDEAALRTDTVLMSIKLVRNLARDRLLHETLIKSAGPWVLASIQKFPGTRVQLEGLRALLNLSVAHQMLLCEQGVAEVVCTATIHENARHDSNEAITMSKLSCEVMSRLALDVQVRASYLQVPVTKLLLELLSAHANLAAVVENSFQMLCVLIGDVGSAEYVGAYPEVLPSVITAARAHLRNVSICEWFCRCVCAWSRSPPNRDRLFVSGSLQLVADVMRTHAPHHAGVAAFGCAAFRAASHQHRTNKIALVKSLDASQLVLRAMQNHITSEPVCFYGCSAIWSLANEMENKMIMIKTGADAVVINVMRTNPDSVHVNAQACAALWSLANYDRGKTQMLRNGAAQAIIHAMKKFVHQRADVALNGSAALWSLSIPLESRNMLIELGAAKLVLEVMTIYPKDVDICGKCLGTMQCLTDEGISVKDMTFMVVTCGALRVLLTCCRDHFDNGEVIEQLCEIWTNMALLSFRGGSNKLLIGDDQHIGEWEEIRTVGNAIKTRFPREVNESIGKVQEKLSLLIPSSSMVLT